MMLEPTPDVINSIGLGLDAIGIVLLFFFGLPSDVTKDGITSLAIEQKDEDEARKWVRHRCISRIALIFLLTGFALQIVSNHVDPESVEKTVIITNSYYLT